MLLALGVVLLVAGLTARAMATPERRAWAHRRATDALARSEERLDRLAAEMEQVDGAATTTRRAIRQKALDREARRAKRNHRFQEWRVGVTTRLVARDADDVSPPGR